MFSLNSLILIMVGSLILLQVSIPCFFGSKIKSISGRYLISIQYGKWMSRDDRKDIVILQEVLKNSLEIQAEIFNVNSTTFLKILKAVYSLFTFFLH